MAPDPAPPPLAERLATVLADVLPVEREPDGALTVNHSGTLASLRVVGIVEDLDLVSLTQILAWGLPLTDHLRDVVHEQADTALLGTVTLLEKDATANPASKTADVMLRYNFPGGGLTDDALRTLILLVLEKGADIRRALASD